MSPLMLVIVTVVTLWIFGKFLARASVKIDATNPKKQIRGIKIGNQLHVVGLNDVSLELLKDILISKDIKRLSFFVSFYKPTFVELEESVTTLRTRFNSFLGKPIKESSEIEKIAAANRVLISDQPKRYNFGALNRAELRQLYQFESKNQRQINYDFITKFGGNDDFMDQFRLFNELKRGAQFAQYIPKESKHRSTLESLVKSGLVLQGRKIELQDRLSVLTISQLKDIAQELKISVDFKSKDEALETIAKLPGSSVRLAMIHDMDDIFLVLPETFNVKEIEDEWSVFSTYAKLIAGFDNEELNLGNNTLLADDLT